VAAADPRQKTLRRTARRISLGGLLAALILGAVIAAFFAPTADLALFSIASLGVAIAVIELEWRGAVSVFLASGILSLIYPGLAAAWPLLLFFGPYPLLKAVIEQHLPRLAALPVKLLAGDALAALALAVFAWPLTAGLQQKAAGLFWPALIIGGQVVLFLYDYALSLLIRLYHDRIGRRLNP
jgi:hypothetical protein